MRTWATRTRGAVRSSTSTATRSSPAQGGPRQARSSSLPAAQAVAPGYLPTTVAYCRWFWRAMEPEEGCYDFSMIDGALRTATERGQTLAVRLMAFGAPGQPGFPDWYARTCPMAEYSSHGKASIVAPIHRLARVPGPLGRAGARVRPALRRKPGSRRASTSPTSAPGAKAPANAATRSARDSRSCGRMPSRIPRASPSLQARRWALRSERAPAGAATASAI